jgi:hypothetical protein
MPKKLITIGLLIIAALLAVGAVYSHSVTKRRRTMEQIHSQDTNIPTIDAAAPPHTETATFAMG